MVVHQRPVPQTLILVPTRELVEQVTTAAEQLTKYMSVAIAGFYGGVNMKGQMVTADGKLDIVVATPAASWTWPLAAPLS